MIQKKGCYVCNCNSTRVWCNSSDIQSNRFWSWTLPAKRGFPGDWLIRWDTRRRDFFSVESVLIDSWLYRFHQTVPPHKSEICSAITNRKSHGLTQNVAWCSHCPIRTLFLQLLYSYDETLKMSSCCGPDVLSNHTQYCSIDVEDEKQLNQKRQERNMTNTIV